MKFISYFFIDECIMTNMNQSQNPQVQKLLQELQGVEPEKYAILQALREIVFAHNPDTTERIMYGGIMFTSSEDWGGLFVSKKHVSFEFSKGFALEDPKGVLEGSGKYRRHLKIRSLEDVEQKEAAFFVSQIA